ncbi:MAG: phenylalanine--tRNA ligase subunit beta [Gammaproteobacteria bacterium]|nr:phenylalanine--tRNA ligase subunit beta [Gammaproteobacteria bacterium]
MKISMAWLSEWVTSGLPVRELSDRLTMAGLEVEFVAPAAPIFDGVVVAEIIDAIRHPQADKLKVCKVVIGDGAEDRCAPLQIVCGAANARVGLRTALAKVGAILPGGTEIKAVKLRGVESAGMLCSVEELGLAETSDGILELPTDAPLGATVRDFLSLDDQVLELSITPNRGDAMSVRGIAREVAALTGATLTTPDSSTVPSGFDDAVLTGRAAVNLLATTACPRFHGRVIVEVDNTRRSPTWLVERLRRSGLRSISPIVDITNFILLELGQPMHAYDLDKVEGPLTVRLARDSERCELLDGRTVDLTRDVLVIADQVGPVALAGVMGGQRTAVSSATTRVLFEVAWFTPSAISGRGRRYGLATDASQRFERGVDPEVGIAAIERATALLLAIAGGRAGGVVTVEDSANIPTSSTVSLRINQLKRLLGRAFSEHDVISLLMRLGMSARASSPGVLEVEPPSSRFDIQIERDLIEEVARLTGFDALPTSVALAPKTILAQPTQRLDEQHLLDVLSARGYHEGIHFAFVDPELQSLMFPGMPSHVLSNPIASDLAVMRLSLWPGLLKAALENQRRQQSRVRLFEHGVVFPVDEPERDCIAGLALGSRWPEQWDGGRDSVDFFDIRADVEALLSLSATPGAFTFGAASSPALHPGRSARISRSDRTVGWIGEVHPRLVKALGFVSTPVIFELDIEALSVVYAPHEEVSRFPQVRRDLAVLVDESVTAAQLCEQVKTAASSLLRDVVVFDVYRGQGIELGRKSVALGLIFQDKDRTLTDIETGRVIVSVRDALTTGLGAGFRE